MSVRDSLDVFLADEHIGICHRVKGSARDLSAERVLLEVQSHPIPLSLSFPNGQPDSVLVLNWMQGLLPDDRSRLRWLAQQYRVEPTPFELLGTEIGLDCAGAVQFSAGELPSASGRTLSESTIANRLRLTQRQGDIHISRPAAAVRFPQRALSGQHPKIGVCYQNGEWTEPSGTMPSTHIIKLPPQGLESDAFIEALCQDTAAILGLGGARCRPYAFDGVQSIVYRRFDRATREEGPSIRLHQEDVLQALGMPPGRKYQALGGPNPSHVIALIRQQCLVPEAAVLQFVDALIYNHLIGATDAHAKNFALLLEGGNVVTFAPLYDTSSSLPWVDGPDETVAGQLSPAMWPTGETNAGLQNPTISDLDDSGVWHRFAVDHQLDPPALLGRMKELADAVPDAFALAAQTLPGHAQGDDAVLTMLRRVKQRALTAIKGLRA